MAKKIEKLAEKIHELSDIEKLRLVEVIWTNPTQRSTGLGGGGAQTLGSIQGRSSPNGFL